MTIEANKTPYLASDVFRIYRISWNVRKKMLEVLLQLAQPTEKTTVLDVGVTNDRRRECNFFEKLYPYPSKVTAVAREDASFLVKEFSGLKFIRADGLTLPFEDKGFDLVVSFATIEHVGCREKQRRFIHELCRVGKTVCVSTPNRWYPVEFHTFLPLVHWLPAPWFRYIIKLLGENFLALEDNLNLLSEMELLNLFPSHTKICIKYFRLFGLKSNLLCYITT